MGARTPPSAFLWAGSAQEFPPPLPKRTRGRGRLRSHLESTLVTMRTARDEARLRGARRLSSRESMKNVIFQELAEAARRGEAVALGLISGVKGSSPQKI